jgi:hypothetical protein
MRHHSGRLLALACALAPVLAAVGLGFAMGLHRPPTGGHSVLNGKPAVAAAPLQPEPIAPPAAWKVQVTAIARPALPLEIKCRISLPSCRKWVALQERKGRLLVHSAQR